MKPFKKLFLLLLITGLTACSVEEVEKHPELEFQELNAVVEIPGCDAVSFDYNQAGRIEVTNDQDSLYVSIIPADDNLLMNTKLHIANSYDDFPTVGRGNLPPGQMDQQDNFGPGVAYVTYSYSLSEYDECIYLASHSSFVSGANSITSWAGDISGQSGNWSYFEYCIQNCVSTCELDAGPDNSITLTLSEASALPDYLAVKDLYISMLNDGVSIDGTFDPSIRDLIDAFQNNGVGEYSTVYTIEEGECKDSVVLTLSVVPDQPED